MKKQLITLMCAAALLSSCHIYKAYDRPADITTDSLYRDTVSHGHTLPADTANFGNLAWQEVFTDAHLQTLIEKALTQSPDMRTAALKVKETKAALTSAKLAYLPSLTLSPQGVVSSWDKGKATQTYSLPVNASWQIDLFGQILNPKRQAKAALEQVKAYEQNARVQLIANTANLYYTLLMLDRQLQISEETAEILKKNAETVEAMKEAGFYGTTQAAVEQSKAAYAQVQASLPDLRANIREVENTLCLLLGETAHRIERGRLEEQQLPTEFSVGLPLQLLSNRPDVRAAEQALASAYYNTNTARANFYPRIMLSGSAGWTNSAGAAIVNPGKLLASAVASLTQPLFQNGANIARLKIAKAQQEEAKIQFEQALLNAGNEVSNALYSYQACKEKAEARATQVTSAQNAAEYSKELFNLGNSTYLEVLSAQQAYLSAQLSEITDTFSQMQAVISLYQALGGGQQE